MRTMKHWAIAAMTATALALAGCGGGGSTAGPTTPTPDPALGAAQTAAMTAATAADTAADAAEAAVMAQSGNAAADQASYDAANEAAMDARAAATAAAAASAAADATDDVAQAEAQQAIAVAQKDIAERAKADADMYAGMVQTAQATLDEGQRVMDVASARSAAMKSYMDADAHATKAEMAAGAAEKAAPGSPGAMDAREAAVAARVAATAAKAAHDAIMDDMTKEQADAQAAEAATQAGNANSSYMTAKAENDDIQTAKTTTDEQNRQRDVATATSAASDAATAARSAAMMARENATKARKAANDANAAYMRAVAGRTDSSEAKTQADAAAAAATMAESAAMTAEMAAGDAEAAHMGIDPAGSGDAARMAQMTAETEQDKAETAQGTASTQYMTAMTASGVAATAASEHVLSLFLAANGAHVMDLESTPTVDDKAAHVTSVGAAMAAIAEAASGAQAAGTTASATFPGDTVANPDADPATELMPGMFSIMVNVNGDTEIESEFRDSRAATDLNDDGDTTDDGEARIIQTAMKIADLGDFQGYDLWEDDGDATTNTDRARAIVFTNKQQGDDSKLTVVGGAARSVNGQTVANTELTNVRSTGNTITGVTWTPSGEAPLTGTLECTGDACNIVLGEDGAVTTIVGYTFTGSRATVEAVTAAVATEDNDYLAFGLWLQENDDGTTDTFGAFASGGTDYAVGAQTAVTGTARYTGKAAGAHHRTGDGVNWFDGDASLTANFGAADADGTISGEISNIRVAGGEAMSTSIYLGQADLTGGTATFNGAAFMGAATAPGAPTHEFDGTWSGSFFGATANDADTADVDESVTAPLATAGTFGVTKSKGTGDDMVVESFVGAFGAHKDDN